MPEASTLGVHTWACVGVKALISRRRASYADAKALDEDEEVPPASKKNATSWFAVPSKSTVYTIVCLMA